MSKLTDEDPMPFGKHKGKPLSSVPASYLYWWWTQANGESDLQHPLHRYVKTNLNSLSKEYPDGLWEVKS